VRAGLVGTASQGGVPEYWFLIPISRILEVQEVGPGTYSIGVSHSLGGISQNADAIMAAVDKAGECCHSKGQKLLITPNPGKDVTFRCVSSDEANAINEQRAH